MKKNEQTFLATLLILPVAVTLFTCGDPITDVLTGLIIAADPSIVCPPSVVKTKPSQNEKTNHQYSGARIVAGLPASKPTSSLP